MYTVAVNTLSEKESTIIVSRQIYRLRGTHLLIVFSKIWNSRTNLRDRFMDNDTRKIICVNDPRYYLFSLVSCVLFYSAATISWLTYVSGLTTYFNEASYKIIFSEKKE